VRSLERARRGAARRGARARRARGDAVVRGAARVRRRGRPADERRRAALRLGTRRRDREQVRRVARAARVESRRPQAEVLPGRPCTLARRGPARVPGAGGGLARRSRAVQASARRTAPEARARARARRARRARAARRGRAARQARAPLSLLRVAARARGGASRGARALRAAHRRGDRILGVDGTLAVDCTSTRSAITHSQFAALKVKDAIVDQFRDATGVRPSVDVAAPDVRVNLHLDRDVATLAIDLSGESLHRRGYRGPQGAAPLKENLAAAVLLRSGWPA